jgi:hypothetical protein
MCHVDLMGNFLRNRYVIQKINLYGETLMVFFEVNNFAVQQKPMGSFPKGGLIT